MIAEILCVGTELLIGDIVNTNAAFLSRELAAMGIFVYYQSVCGDNALRLNKCIDNAISRSDIVIMTGGLGPTYDDMTKETVAKYFNLDMIMHQESLSKITEFFDRIGKTMTENNKKQALMPKNSIIFKNDYGTAPGVAIENENKVIIMLPGPPREMKPIFLDEVKPYLAKFSESKIISKNINIFGMGESAVENLLKNLMENTKNPTIAPYVNDGEVRIRLSANAKNIQEADEIINPYIEKIVTLLGKTVYGINMSSIEEALVKKLKSKNMKIATCESCTGGLISKRITDISGSSSVFGYGICTYTEEAKIKILDVKFKTLEKFGVVSGQVAEEMASGILKLSGADIAISTTGIAGPDGGTDDKPIGLVYVGCATKNKVFSERLLLCRGNSKERDYIRSLAATNALKLAFDEIDMA